MKSEYDELAAFLTNTSDHQLRRFGPEVPFAVRYGLIPSNLRSGYFRPGWRHDMLAWIVHRGGIGMMKTRVIVCFLWLAGCLANAQNSARSSHGSESLLLALENAWNQAQLYHDSKALDGLVGDSFISTDNDGTFMNKAQFLADNKDLSYAPSLMTNSGERIFLYDNVAVVAGIYHAKGLNKGKPFDHYGRFTDTWVYLHEKWLCVASHTSALKK